MRRAAALLLVLVACAGGQARRLPSTRVVLISLDGLGADELRKQQGLQSFAKLEREGLHIERVIPVNPTATAVAHVAILTGAEPNVTGIVANRFHEPGTPHGQLTDAFAADIGAETLVEAAHRAGKRVASIAFPTVDGRNARRAADWGLAFVQPLTRGRTIRLKRSDFVECGHAVCAAIDWLERKVEVRASDTTNDGVENYDTIRFDDSSSDANDWFALSQRVDGSLLGSWSKVMRFDSDLNVTLYWGAISRSVGYPESFRKMIDDTVGFWPGEPDESTDPDTFIEQNDRFTQFLTDAALAAMRTTDFDLLLIYQPAIDKAEHPFKGMLPAQRAYQGADRAIAAIVQELTPQRDALVVTGDHGLAPIEMEVRLGRLIADWGFAPQWQVYGNGNVGHLYGSDRTDALIEKLRGTGYFERIERKTARSHPNSGDIMLYSYPHIALSSAGGNVEPVVKPAHRGQHGGLNSYPQFHTTLFAWGRGVKPGEIAEEGQTRIARLISGLLGIDPPREAE